MSKNPKSPNLQIAKLATGDAKYYTDHLREFRNLILANEPMYPDIGRWFNTKVLPGLKSGQRTAFIGYVDERPVVSAVVKRGERTKFCHLKISEEYQGSNLGDLFFSLMALEARQFAKSVYFTLPESLWDTKGNFFQSFNFENVQKADVQYRLIDTELSSEASFHSVWSAVLNKLPKLCRHFDVGGFSLENDLLMSIRPEFATRILNNEKTVEIRRRFSKRWVGRKVSIYATAPTTSLVGEAMINNVRSGSPQEIWREFSSGIGCSKAEFERYTQGTEEVYAIILDRVKPYHGPVTLSYISRLLDEDLLPPQSYCTLEKGKPWANAVSIATLLHGFKGTGIINTSRRSTVQVAVGASCIRSSNPAQTDFDF